MTSIMRPHVVAYTDCDLVHTSYVFTGLIDLANAGRVDLTFRVPRWVPTKYRGRFTVWLEVTDPQSAVTRRGCLDVHDVNSYFSLESLSRCDLYFKSNFNADAVQILPESQRAKVRPLGPYFACRSGHDRGLFTRNAGSVLSLVSKLGLTRVANNRANMYRVYQSIVGRPQRYKKRLTVNEYESDHPGNGVQPSIYFNPSCWPEKNDSIREINRLRADVIRNLRREFGPRFLGGFIRSKQAEALYPDCISDVSYDHQAYVRTIQSSLISIYTNGLNGCLSWKLGEYMASATCIVGEPLTNQLAVPMEDGRDIFFFRSMEECLAHCARLLSEPEASREARVRTADYYASYVRPSANLWRVIQRLSAESK